MNSQCSFIRSRRLKIALFLITMQQIFVAFGTYLLGELSRALLHNSLHVKFEIECK